MPACRDTCAPLKADAIATLQRPDRKIAIAQALECEGNPTFSIDSDFLNSKIRYLEKI